MSFLLHKASQCKFNLIRPPYTAVEVFVSSFSFSIDLFITLGTFILFSIELKIPLGRKTFHLNSLNALTVALDCNYYNEIIYTTS